MSDTPRSFCPKCQPEADEFAEFLVVEYCSDHRPTTVGTEDAKVGPSWWASGASEITGEENRAACQVIHRGGEPK